MRLAAGPLSGLGPAARAWIELVLAFLVMAPATVLGMKLLGVPEMNPFLSRLERLVDRRKPKRGGVR